MVLFVTAAVSLPLLQKTPACPPTSGVNPKTFSLLNTVLPTLIKILSVLE